MISMSNGSRISCSAFQPRTSELSCGSLQNYSGGCHKNASSTPTTSWGLWRISYDTLENLELAGVKLREGMLAEENGEENGGDDKVMQEIAKAGQETDT